MRRERRPSLDVLICKDYTIIKGCFPLFILMRNSYGVGRRGSVRLNKQVGSIYLGFLLLLAAVIF